MKQFIIIATFLIGLAIAQNPLDQQATVRSYKNVLNENGQYEYQFDTTNGIAVQESGVGGYYATGSAQHYAPDGQLVQLTYTADENGFHPEGAHLPTPPPVPEYILRAIEYIRTHPPTERPGKPHY